MTVRMTQVTSICTAAEIELVRASRKPQLDRLTPAQVKSAATRARGLIDKWRGQSRSQGRQLSRKGQAGDEATRTQLKVQIFAEALETFNQRLPKLEAEGTAVKSDKPNSKKARAMGHRATRAGVRDQLTEAQMKLNFQATVAKNAKRKAATTGQGLRAKVTSQIPVPAPSAAEVAKRAANGTPSDSASTSATGQPSQAKSLKSPVVRRATSKTGQQRLSTTKAKQRQAATIAKQARVVQSGVTSRLRGHVSARGRRDQRRRDSRNA